jgi:hypothetical protein
MMVRWDGGDRFIVYIYTTQHNAYPPTPRRRWVSPCNAFSPCCCCCLGRRGWRRARHPWTKLSGYVLLVYVCMKGVVSVHACLPCIYIYTYTYGRPPSPSIYIHTHVNLYKSSHAARNPRPHPPPSSRPPAAGKPAPPPAPRTRRRCAKRRGEGGGYGGGGGW